MIPKDKVNGLRFGQLLYAALIEHGIKYKAIMADQCGDSIASGTSDHYIADKLFNIENKALEQAIERVLNK